MKKSELKEMIKAAMSEDMGKSVFDTNKPSRIEEFIKALDGLVDEYHAELYLNDELFAAINDVKTAAKSEMGREDAAMSWAKKTTVDEGLLDFLKKKKEAAPVKKEDPNPIIGVDYDGNYIRKDGTMAEAIDEGLLDFLKKKKKEAPKAEDSPKLVGVDFDGNYIYSDDPNISKKSYAKLGEDDRTDAEGMTEAEKVDVKDDEEVDVDIEKDVEIDDESVESDIEITDTEEEVTSELDGTNQKTLKALEAALESARELGDEKLINQIGNTITFFTRQHIVKEEDLFERKRMLRLAGILK
jgi:hypothetical protein